MNKQIQLICEEYAKDKKFSGVCVVKSENEILYSGAFGYANKAFHIPNKIDTKFDVASVTKIFTATAILLLVEKGLLKLEDKITELIDLKQTKIPEDVTIHHLLCHTSGIADDADEENGENYSDLFVEHPNYAIRSCKDFLPNFVYKEPNFKAGTNRRYNNCAYILLGLAIEKITNMDCRDFMSKEIFEKCNMKNTGFLAMDQINENTAEGYVEVVDEHNNFISWKKNIYSYPPVGTPDGGVYTTAEDLDQYMRELLTYKILSKEYVELLLSPRCDFTDPTRVLIEGKANYKYGYGFEFLEVDGQVLDIYKDGVNEGVSSMFAYYPKTKITVSILANQNCNVWSMHREIQSVLCKIN